METTQAHTYYLLGQRLAKSRDFGRAEQLFALALEKEPENIIIMVAAGKAAQQAGDPALARRYFEQALPYKRYLPPTVNIKPPVSWPDPRQMAIYDADLGLGLLLLRQGQATAGITHLEAAAARFPIGLEAHFYLIGAYTDTGRYQQALDSCRTYLKILPTDRRVQQRAAWLRQQLLQGNKSGR